MFPEQRKLTEEQFNEMIDGRGLSWPEEQVLRSTFELSHDNNFVASQIELSSHLALIAWQKIRGNPLLSRPLK